MNSIIIFAGTAAVQKKLESSFSSSWNISTRSFSELRKLLKNPDSETFYIFDYTSSEENSRRKDISYFLKKTDLPRAVADRKKEIADPADIVMKNCDYISGSLLKDGGYKAARLNKYREFANAELQSLQPATAVTDSSSHKIQTDGWNGIRSGKSYSFFMLYTEISLPAEWKKNSGKTHLDKIKQTFQTVAEREASFCDGRIWIWNEYGGLILFPYTGNFCIPVIAPLKLMMNRLLISVEDFSHHSPINIKASMHLGKTIWKSRGKTGTIISDSLNSIFHLGTQYTPLNNFDITEEVYTDLQPELKKIFSKAGTFEERNIYRLHHMEILA